MEKKHVFFGIGAIVMLILLAMTSICVAKAPRVVPGGGLEDDDMQKSYPSLKDWWDDKWGPYEKLTPEEKKRASDELDEIWESGVPIYSDT